MTVRVAINGFGRIGRNIVRAIYESGRKDIDIVAINDLGPVETNAHLLRYDSVHGRFPHEVGVDGDSISIGYTAPVRELLKGKANVLRIPTNGGPTTRGLTSLSAWLGITEPAMFGVNLRYKYPFLISIACAGIAGAFISIFNVGASSIGVGGVPGIFAIIPQYWPVFGIAMVFCIVVPGLITMVYGKRQLAGQDAAAVAAAEERDIAAAQV